jgi:hypothetical protein
MRANYATAATTYIGGPVAASHYLYVHASTFDDGTTRGGGAGFTYTYVTAILNAVYEYSIV